MPNGMEKKHTLNTHAMYKKKTKDEKHKNQRKKLSHEKQIHETDTHIITKRFKITKNTQLQDEVRPSLVSKF